MTALEKRNCGEVSACRDLGPVKTDRNDKPITRSKHPTNAIFPAQRTKFQPRVRFVLRLFSTGEPFARPAPRWTLVLFVTWYPGRESAPPVRDLKSESAGRANIFVPTRVAGERELQKDRREMESKTRGEDNFFSGARALNAKNLFTFRRIRITRWREPKRLGDTEEILLTGESGHFRECTLAIINGNWEIARFVAAVSFFSL